MNTNLFHSVLLLAFAPSRRTFVPRLVAVLLAVAPLAQAQDAPAPAPATPTAAVPAPVAAGSELNLDTINQAIRKGVQALYAIEPQYTFPPEYQFTHGGFNQELRNMMGNHALACWAMLVAGESYQNPPLYRRINWVMSSDQPLIYDRGMRLQMLGELPRLRWGPWVHRDFFFLSQALTQEGSFNASYSGGASNGLGDNANGQYGVLGLWAAQRQGESIPTAVWDRIDKYWRAAQEKTEGDKPAGWAVYSLAGDNKDKLGFYTRISGPMTAGGVATLALTERYVLADPKAKPRGNHLHKGIRWLDENFALDDKAEATDWFYYMWTIQGVGRATGYRTFNKVDWFREVTAELLKRQQPDGIWAGDKGRLLSTGFALLYLARANDPLSIAKLRFNSKDNEGKITDAWNNRTHDMVNFVEYASDQYEVDMTWQIAEPDQSVYELIESPMLWVSTDRAFSLTDDQVNTLRDYVQAGGLIVTNPEGSDMAAAVRAYKELAARLFPGRELQPLDREHPLMNLHQPVKGLQFQVIDNGLRPLMIHSMRDIGAGLQGNEVGKSEGFEAMSNFYLYVTGMNPRRPRLENNFVVQRHARPSTPLPAARIRHSGNFDPEPNALPQVKAILANQFDVDMQLSTVEPGQLGTQRVAFLTTTGDGKLSADEAAAIKRWVDAGGTLWLDAAGGSRDAAHSAEAMLKAIYPDAATTPLPSDSPILSGKTTRSNYDNRRVEYRFFALRTMGPASTPRLEYLDVSGRTAVIYSNEDLTCGLAGLDHWNIFGYKPVSARRLVVNGLMSLVGTQAPPAPAPVAATTTVTP